MATRTREADRINITRLVDPCLPEELKLIDMPDGMSNGIVCDRMFS